MVLSHAVTGTVETFLLLLDLGPPGALDSPLAHGPRWVLVTHAREPPPHSPRGASVPCKLSRELPGHSPCPAWRWDCERRAVCEASPRSKGT